MSQITYRVPRGEYFVRCGWDVQLQTFFFDVFADQTEDQILYEHPMFPPCVDVREIEQGLEREGLGHVMRDDVARRLYEHKRLDIGNLVVTLP